MNRFDTLANSILESLNEADAAKGITNNPATFKNIVLPLKPGAKPLANLGGTNQPPVAPTFTNQPPRNVGGATPPPAVPTSTNQPPRNVGGATPPYDPNRDPLLKDIPGLMKPYKFTPRRGAVDMQKYLKRRKEMDARHAAENAAYLKRRKEMDAKDANKTKPNPFTPQP